MGTEIQDSRLTEYQIETLYSDLNRLGDSVRQESRLLATLTAEVQAKDLILEYRLNLIETSETESRKSRQHLWYGVLGSLIVTGINFLLKQ